MTTIWPVEPITELTAEMEALLHESIGAVSPDVASDVARVRADLAAGAIHGAVVAFILGQNGSDEYYLVNSVRATHFYNDEGELVEKIYGGKWDIEPDPIKHAHLMIAHIDKKRQELGIDKARERVLMDMADRQALEG